MIHFLPARVVEAMTLWTRKLLFMVLLLDFTSDIWTLPAPSGIFMDSVDMKHVLTWAPPKALCNTTLLYSVQYQGDFERLMNGSWLKPPECQQIRVTRCDLTHDLGSDSDYIIQVRAQCGPLLSAWTGPQFNRKDTVLQAPDMKVTMAGVDLQVSIKKPLTATGRVTVWRKDHELQPVVHVMSDEQEVLHIAHLQEGAEYCVKARVVLHTGVHSGFTDTCCVFVTGPGAPAWKKPTTVTVTVVATLGLLVGFFWFIVHCQPKSCQQFFHKPLLPPHFWVSDLHVVIVVPGGPREDSDVLEVETQEQMMHHKTENTDKVHQTDEVPDLNSREPHPGPSERLLDEEGTLRGTAPDPPSEVLPDAQVLPADWNSTVVEHEVLLGPSGFRIQPSVPLLYLLDSAQAGEELELLSRGSGTRGWVQSGPELELLSRGSGTRGWVQSGPVHHTETTSRAHSGPDSCL